MDIGQRFIFVNLSFHCWCKISVTYVGGIFLTKVRTESKRGFGSIKVIEKTGIAMNESMDESS